MGLNHGADRRRIGGQHIGRRHRVDELAHIKTSLELGVVIEIVGHRIDQALQPFCVQHPGPAHEAESWVGVPFGIRESTIFRHRRIAGHGLEQVHPALEEGHHGMPRLFRVPRKRCTDLHLSLDAAKWIWLSGGGRGAVRTADCVDQHALRFLNGLHEIGRHCLQ